VSICSSSGKCRTFWSRLTAYLFMPEREMTVWGKGRGEDTGCSWAQRPLQHLCPEREQQQHQRGRGSQDVAGAKLEMPAPRACLCLSGGLAMIKRRPRLQHFVTPAANPHLGPLDAVSVAHLRLALLGEWVLVSVSPLTRHAVGLRARDLVL
jgi:hypothetical protein